MGAVRSIRSIRSSIDGNDVRTSLWHLTRMRSKGLFLLSGPVEEVRLKLGATLIKRDSMTEYLHGRIGGSEGKTMWDDANRVDRVPDERRGECTERDSNVDTFSTYQTPMKSMSTSMEKAFLNAVLCFHPASSVLRNILYAKGTC